MAKLSFPGFVDYAFIPYAPESVKEALEFATDVMPTHDGGEERTATRAVARQIYQYEVPADLLKRQSPFNLLEQNIRGNWAVPVWPEAQYVGTVSGTTIACDTIASDFRVDGLVLIFRTNDLWELRQIDSMTDGQLTLTASATSVTGAYVIPVNAATLVGPVGQRMGVNSTVYFMKFEMSQPRAHQTSIGMFLILDHSDIMFGHSLDRSKASLAVILAMLSGAVVNSGCRVDLGICLLAASGVTTTWIDATAADIAEAAALVAATTATADLSPDPNDGFTDAVTFFTTTSPNYPGRYDFLYYISGSNEVTTTAATTAADLLAGTGAFSGSRNVEARAIIFSQDEAHEAGQQRELVNNWNDLQTGVDNWSNDSATGADSAETFGGFTNAYELGLSGAGQRRQLDSIDVSFRTPYQVRGWFKGGSTGGVGGRLLLRRNGLDDEIRGNFATPAILEEEIGDIQEITSTDLGGGVWSWSFETTMTPHPDNVIIAIGNASAGESVVLFAASLRRAWEPDPDTTQALLVDNASGGVITVVGDDNPGALEDRIRRDLAPYIGSQFNGYEIFADEPDGDEQSRSIMKQENRVDFGGAYTTLSPWLYSKIASSHLFPRDDLSDLKQFREFIYRRFGRARLLYLPTFQYDIHPLAVIDNGFTITCPEADIRAFNSDREQLAIKWADGFWQGVSITSVVDAGGGNVNVGLGVQLVGELADIRQICFMGLGRFDTDRIEIEWLGYHVTETSINMVEIYK